MALRNIEDLIALHRAGRRLMALDLGTKTIGLAVTAGEGMVLPVETIARTARAAAIEAIADAATGRQIAGIAVGYPLNMDGSVGPAAQRAKAFAHALAKALPDAAVALVDERLTTEAALDDLRGRTDLRDAKRAGAVDALAAAKILEAVIVGRAA